MLRKYNNYRYVKPLRKNAYLVKDGNGNSCVLSAQPIQNQAQQGVNKRLQIYSQLSHPNVDKAIDVFISRTNSLYLQQLVVVTKNSQNTCLDALFGGLSSLETSFALIDIAQGLKYLHSELKVVHKNIRCHSILKKEGKYVISNFIAAQKLVGNQSASGLVGKKYSMSPEMITGVPYSFPTDIWSLGILFVELLVGIPFRQIQNRMAAFIEDFPKSLLDKIEEDWAKQLLKKMFQKDPNKRLNIQQILDILKLNIVDPWQLGKNMAIRTLSSSTKVFLDSQRRVSVSKTFELEGQESIDRQWIDKCKGLLHPSVVQIYDICEQDSLWTIESEYCPSGPLLWNLEQIHQNEIIDIIEQIWSGFTYLKTRKMIRRGQISLSSILLSEGRPKLNIAHKQFLINSAQQEESGLIGLIIGLFVSLLRRQQLRQGNVDATVKTKDSLGIKDPKLEIILLKALSFQQERLALRYVNANLVQYLQAKRHEQVKISYRKYRIVSQISSGAFGKVYLSETPDLQQYALKVIPCVLKSQEDEANLEAFNLGKTNHPNIVQMYEFFCNDSRTQMILVTECCNQDTLREAIPNLSQPQKAKAIKQLCDVVRYLHQDLGMVHRDIKPANILLKNGTLKLCDFGRSKFLKQDQTISGVVGNDYYMPPEMAESEKYSFSVDIWNLGVVLLEVCLGRVTCSKRIAFMDSSFPNNLLKQVRNDHLRELLGRMIQRQPAKRFSISQIQEELNRKHLHQWIF